MRGQNAMDTVNVRTARWVTKVPWHGWSAASCPQANRFVLGSPSVLFVKTVKGPLFPSTNRNFYRTCFPNFKGAINLNLWYRIKYMDNLLSVSRKFLEIPGIFCAIGHTISPDAQGPVVRKPISVNPRLKVN